MTSRLVSTRKREQSKMDMKTVLLTDESSEAKVKVSLFGATVVSWTVGGRERLFLSQKAL